MMGYTSDLKWYPDAETPFGADEDMRSMMESFGGFGYVETEAAKRALPASEKEICVYVRETQTLQQRIGTKWSTIRRFGNSTQDPRSWSATRPNSGDMAPGVLGSNVGLAISAPPPGIYSIVGLVRVQQLTAQANVTFVMELNGTQVIAASRTLNAGAYDFQQFTEISQYAESPAEIRVRMLNQTTAGMLTLYSGAYVRISRIGDL